MQERRLWSPFFMLVRVKTKSAGLFGCRTIAHLFSSYCDGEMSLDFVVMRAGTEVLLGVEHRLGRFPVRDVSVAGDGCLSWVGADGCMESIAGVPEDLIHLALDSSDDGGLLIAGLNGSPGDGVQASIAEVDILQARQQQAMRMLS